MEMKFLCNIVTVLSFKTVDMRLLGCQDGLVEAFPRTHREVERRRGQTTVGRYLSDLALGRGAPGGTSMDASLLQQFSFWPLSDLRSRIQRCKLALSGTVLTPSQVSPCRQVLLLVGWAGLPCTLGPICLSEAHSQHFIMLSWEQPWFWSAALFFKD